MTSSSLASYYQEARETLDSPTFSASANDEMKWFLRVYPNGYDGASEHHLCIYLVLASCNQSAVRALFTVSILDTDGKKTLGRTCARRFVQVRATPQGRMIPFEFGSFFIKRNSPHLGYCLWFQKFLSSRRPVRVCAQVSSQ